MKLMQNSGVPIYQQIADSFKTDILAGRYEQGEFLPSIRGLAKDLKISVITTMKAYEQLADEGLITAAQGKGFYVNAQDSEMIKEQHLRKVEESLTDAIAAAEVAGISNDELKGMLEALLDVENFAIPQGFATALIGENGAGKTTLLNILAGIRLDYKGEITYFGQYSDKQKENSGDIKNRIGYTGPGKYYLPQWTVKDIEEISKLMFDDFSADDFHRYCEELAIFSHGSIDMKKANSSFSDGMKMKLMLAGVMARKTDLLLLDEPASPLDPLMRDKLCQMIGEYIHEGNGKRSVFFSTHNISDMENITDYAIIMENGQIVEQGFVEDLKEKYILIKGDAADTEAAGKVLYSMTKNPYGFEGICLAENIDKLAGLNVTKEIPTLYQISVAVMKNNTKIVMR